MSTRLPTALQSLLICLLILATGAPAASAQDPVDYDTVSVRDIGPGVQHIEYLAPSGPWTLDVITVDVTDPLLQIETANAQGLVAHGYEKTSSMAARNDSAGHRVVGAVNGDFYSGSNPVSISVQDGEILQDDANGSRPAIGFDAEDRVMMGLVTYSGAVEAPGATTDIDGVNESRGASQLLLYNELWGSSTRTSDDGAEAAVVPLDRWFVNDTTRVIVQDVAQDQGNMTIPATGAVLSGNGSAATFISSEVSVGDTLTVTLNALPGISEVDDMIAGQPLIVRDGEVNVGARGDGADRHPRTAYGVSEDSTKLFLVTVDGRQQSSIGMTLYELGDFMQRIGVHTAMNVDGGGSSTMVVRGGIVNSPSDGGGERSIGSNALLVVSTAPDESLNDIQITPTNRRLFMGRSAQFSARGVDQYYNTVPLDDAEISYTVDSGLGSIDSDGRFTAGSEQDTGFVYVHYGNQYTDTARVVVKTIADFDLYPTEIVTDTARDVSFYIRAFDQDGYEQSVSLDTYNWTSTNPDVGNIEDGRFSGEAPGSTTVVASFRQLTDSSSVRVVVRDGTHTFLSLEDTGGWTLDGENIDVDASEIDTTETEYTEGIGAFKVDYTYQFNPRVLRWVHLRTDIPIEGTPDSTYIDARSSNSAFNQVLLLIEDAQGNLFQVPTTPFANETDSFIELGGSFDNANALEGDPTFYYPARLRGISMKVQYGSEDGAVYNETMYLDNLRMSYAATTTAIDPSDEIPSAIKLFDNYPNPFREVTTIAYGLPQPMTVSLSLYDVLGRKLRTIDIGHRPAGQHDIQLHADDLAAGVYFYQLQADRHQRTGKMVIIE